MAKTDNFAIDGSILCPSYEDRQQEYSLSPLEQPPPFSSDLSYIITCSFIQCHSAISHALPCIALRRAASLSLFCFLLFFAQSQPAGYPMHPIAPMASRSNAVDVYCTTPNPGTPESPSNDVCNLGDPYSNPRRDPPCMDSGPLSFESMDTIHSRRFTTAIGVHAAIPKDPTPSQSSGNRPIFAVPVSNPTKEPSTDSRASLILFRGIMPYLLALIALHRCGKPVSLPFLCLLLLAISRPVQSQQFNFTCLTSYNCSNIQCPDNQDCLVQCIGSSSCRSTTISGNSNGNLEVQCLGGNSCRGTTITPIDGDFTLTCSGGSSCYQTVVNSPVNGSMSVQCSNSKGCQYVDIYCPQFGVCDIDCSSSGSLVCSTILVDATNTISGNLLFQSIYSSKSGTIRCPGNNNDCIVYCGENGCESFSFFTQSDTGQLDISATGADALLSAKIYCPSGHGCSIHAFGDSSGMLTDTKIHSVHAFDEHVSLNCNVSNTTNCYDASFPPQIGCSSDYGVVCNIGLQSGYNNWQCVDHDITTLCSGNTTSGHYGSYFVCNDAYECESVICNDNQDCVVKCIGGNSCRRGSVRAPSNGNLEIQCSSGSSCRDARVTANNTGDFTVICSQSQSCQSAYFYGPINGNMSVQCSNTKACNAARVYCPISGSCDVDCSSTKSGDCNSIVVDATSMIAGGLSFQSVYLSTGGTIRCPGNSNECLVYCGESGCVSFTIYTEDNTGKLDISATGMDALKSAAIYCPPSDECSVHAFGNSSGMLTDTRIYTIDVSDRLSFNCNVSNTTNCYDAAFPPQIGCSSDYGVVCNIGLQSGYNDWQCVDNNLTALCNDNTTNGYYGSDFVCDGSYECDSIICSDNHDCVIQCIGANSCRSSANFMGPLNGNLYVECSGTSSCQSSTFTANDNGNFTLRCSGQNSCKQAFFYAPIHGNMSVECSKNSGCSSVDIYCPQFGSCDIDCSDSGSSVCNTILVDATNTISGDLSFRSIYYSKSGTIRCPGNNNDCIVYCGENGCESFSFFTESDTRELDISATGANALKSAKLFCPTGGGECSIHAFGNSSDMLTDSTIHSVHAFDDLSLNCNVSNTTNCYDASLPPQIKCSSDYGVVCNIGLQSGYNNWECADNNITALCNDNTPNGYYGSYFVCNEAYECESIFCTDDQDCVVKCAVTSACRGGSVRIIGPSNGNLDVECSAQYSCRDSTITANSTGNFTLICTGSNSCNNGVFNGPINGDMSVECSNSGGCSSADIYCPQFGSCDVDCASSESSSACKSILVDATNTISGDLSFQSVNPSTSGTIVCPGNNNECTAHCGEGGCESFTFNTQPDTALLDISAIGTASLKSSTIYCPWPGNCSISISAPSSDILSGANIYSVNGLKDLSLVCNYQTDATDCYDDGLHPNIFCYRDFSVSCAFILQSGFDGWECDDGGIIEEVCGWTYSPTSDPTLEPTLDPTFMPTVPTWHPTTSNPTSDPTDVPTQPTNNPIVSSRPVNYTLVYRLILEGDFNALTRYLDSNHCIGMYCSMHDFALGAIETLMHPFYFSRLIIKILHVHRGSVVIEYSINSNGNDLSFVYFAVDTMNASINTDDSLIVANGIDYPVVLNEPIFNYTNTTAAEEGDIFADGVIGLFVFVIFICCCCTICGAFIGIMTCVLRCLDEAKAKLDEEKEEEDTRAMCRTAIYYIFWFISLPLQLIFGIATCVCFCHGCTRHVGLHFIHFMMNALSTILLVAHFTFGDADFREAVANGVSSILFGGLISGETIYGLAIIAFALMNFGTKMRKLQKSHAKWKDDVNETTVSIRIKDLQIVIIGSSDTIFKILSGIAVIIGSQYSGTGLTRNDALQGIVDCIFAAALVGPIKEMTQLLHEYLTVSLMSLPKGVPKPVSNKLQDMVDTKFNPESVKNGIFHFLEDKLAHEAYESKYSEQKTILWNGLWAGLKLLLLAIQQIFAFVAASMLLAVGSDIASFLAFVLICNLCVIVIAFVFCTKFERVSIGLCFKYYLCCLYDQCPTYCEEKWIRLEDTTQNKQDADGGDTNTKEGNADTKDGNTTVVPLVTDNSNATDGANQNKQETGAGDTNDAGNVEKGDENTRGSVVTEQQPDTSEANDGDNQNTEMQMKKQVEMAATQKDETNTDNASS